MVYGLVGLKTHSKTLLIVRREGDRIRRYIHLGTGNYNSVTTGSTRISATSRATTRSAPTPPWSSTQLTGYAAASDYRKFLVAPPTMRAGSRS